MVDEVLELTETIRTRDYPRGLANTYLSTKTKFVIFRGTYQEVVDKLDAEHIPENKVKGFALLSDGNVEVIVHKH